MGATAVLEELHRCYASLNIQSLSSASTRKNGGCSRFTDMEDLYQDRLSPSLSAQLILVQSLDLLWSERTEAK